MSITVLVIGALHALPPLIVGSLIKSRIALILAAVGTAFVAVNAGAGRYTAVDLFFVLAGAVLGWTMISGKKNGLVPPIGIPKPVDQVRKIGLVEPEPPIEQRRSVLVKDAENGNKEAQLFLSGLLIDDGNIYSASSGPWRDLSFQQDMRSGFFWLNKAIDQGGVRTTEFIPDFYEHVLREGKIDTQYLSYCIDAASRVLQKGENEEDREMLDASISIQQIVMAGKPEEAQVVVKGLHDAYTAKYVKVNRMRAH